MNIQAISNNSYLPQLEGNFNSTNSTATDQAERKAKFANLITQKIFGQATTDSNGTISAADFAKALSSLPRPQNLAASSTDSNNTAQSLPSNQPIDFSTIAQQADKNGDGRIDQNEAESLIASLPIPPHHHHHEGGPKEVQHLEQLAQANGGSFTLQQLQADIQQKLGANTNETSPFSSSQDATAKASEIAQKLFAKLDTDNNGKVNANEILAFKQQTQQQISTSQQNTLTPALS